MKIFNTLSGQKEPLRPIEPGKVRMYVCGMTVYDLCHLGHARVLVIFDVVVRHLRDSGYEVTYVRNITDIDDKIIQRANEVGEDFNALTGRFIEAMHEDCAALGVLPPDEEPRATESMSSIIEMVATLMDKGYAYAGESGDIYYSVKKFKPYGRLSGRRLEDLQAGARVEVNQAKADPMDFVLWKRAKTSEPSWDSPWGPGRPGWHIECSAMSTECLGSHFDIHGGGMDLKFPHHENEIAQSEAATGEPFVNCWMHNGFVRVAEEKMSKSLGNFFTVREVLKQYPAEVIRYFILSSHYRSPLNYSDQNLQNAAGAMERLYITLRGLPVVEADGFDEAVQQRFRAAMDDDFNTPEALAILFELAKEINRKRETASEAAAALAASLRGLGAVLGLLQDDPESFLRQSTGGAEQDEFDDATIDSLVAQRDEARLTKNWAEADRLRDELQAMGVLVEDAAEGSTWRRGS